MTITNEQRNAVQAQLEQHEGQTLSQYMESTANPGVGNNAAFASKAYVFSNDDRNIGGSYPPIQEDNVRAWALKILGKKDGAIIANYIETGTLPRSASNQIKAFAKAYDHVLSGLFNGKQDESSYGTLDFVDPNRDLTLVDKEFSRILQKSNVARLTSRSGLFGNTTIDKALGNMGAKFAIFTGGIIQGQIDVSERTPRGLPVRHNATEMQSALSPQAQASIVKFLSENPIGANGLREVISKNNINLDDLRIGLEQLPTPIIGVAAQNTNTICGNANETSSIKSSNGVSLH